MPHSSFITSALLLAAVDHKPLHFSANRVDKKAARFRRLFMRRRRPPPASIEGGQAAFFLRLDEVRLLECFFEELPLLECPVDELERFPLACSLPG